ncbi:Ger(x)C family spore germination protein [Bacillaceae bacterium C204]|uniref:Ger(x)C family spore germination protein n=1 Tax=Neobacillus sp. 204 TaxID=3383351 RepID=UPI00397CAA4B
MMKKMFIWINVCFCLLLLGGCWSSREITELMIVTGMSIDKDEENGDYLVTMQIINPGEIASQTKTERLEVTTYRTTGKTLYEVMRRISTEIPRKIYLSHIQLIIFGEELAKEGIGKALDFISRNQEFRTDFYILISKDGPGKDVLNVLTPTEASPSVSLYSAIEVSEKVWAPTKGVTLDELLNGLVLDGKDPVLTGVRVNGDRQEADEVAGLEQIKPSAVTKITGYAGFKGDKLVGWLNEIESKGYNYIIDNVKSTVGSIPCEEDGNIALEINKAKSKMISNIMKGKPSITMEVNVEANIGEVQCEIDLSKEKTIKKIENDAKDHLKFIMGESVSKAQNELKSDIFGFGEAIHRQHPEAWKRLKGNWDETFPELEINYRINYDIKRLGTISNSFQQDIK